MKDKEMIEEMAKIIDDRLLEARGWLGSMNRGEGYWIAQKLVEHYQPKLPEDSVVLSKKEYVDLKASNFNYGVEQGIATGKILGSKETAEKFIVEMKASESLSTLLDVEWEVFYEMICNDMYKIAKQFGVEIKE